MSGAAQGLAGALAKLPGLRTLDYMPASFSELPAAVVTFESRDAAPTLGGRCLVGRLKVALVVSPASSREAQRALEAYMEPEGPNSVQAAADADTTWGGSVDDGRLVSVDNAGPRRIWGGTYTAADFHFRFVKRLTG